METEKEKETPYWENKNKINSEYIKRYIGKTCYIGFKKPILLSFYSSCIVYDIKAIIKGFDGYFLDLLIPVKKKNYSSILTIDNVQVISSEENN